MHIFKKKKRKKTFYDNTKWKQKKETQLKLNRHLITNVHGRYHRFVYPAFENPSRALGFRVVQSISRRPGQLVPLYASPYTCVRVRALSVHMDFAANFREAPWRTRFSDRRTRKAAGDKATDGPRKRDLLFPLRNYSGHGGSRRRRAGPLVGLLRRKRRTRRVAHTRHFELYAGGPKPEAESPQRIRNGWERVGFVPRGRESRHTWSCRRRRRNGFRETVPENRVIDWTVSIFWTCARSCRRQPNLT